MPDNSFVQDTYSTIDALLGAVLRGEIPPWPGEPVAVEAFQARARLHGVEALLHAAPLHIRWPRELGSASRDRAIRQVMWELRHQQVLAQTLEALASVGVQPVLIKGTALAYSLYSDPALRSRGDTDLLVPAEAKDRTHDVLSSLGFKRSLAVSGEYVSYQASYTRWTPEGDSHTLDLHWKINNSELLSRLFTYDELRRDAQPLPQLCPHALGASRPHALLLACMHRATHKQNPYYVDGTPHHGANRLIWLCDIHLLARRMDEREWDEVKRSAGQKGLRAVCLQGMQQAQSFFHTQLPEHVLDALAQPGRREAPARYLDGSKLRQRWMDWLALGSLRRQLRWVGETLFPPADYMRRRHADRRFGWLPWLYLRRAVRGVLKGLRQYPQP